MTGVQTCALPISSLVLGSPSATNELLLQMGLAVKEDEKQDEAEKMSEDEKEETPKAEEEKMEEKKESKPRRRGRGRKGGDKKQVPEKNKVSGGGTEGNPQGQAQKKTGDGNKNRKSLRPHYRRGNRNKGGKAGTERKQGAGTNQS